MDKHLIDHNYVEGEYIDNIEELLLTVETKTVTYDMCCYLFEDCDWVTFLVLIGKISQCTTVKKSEIVSIGIYNGASPIVESKSGKELINIYQ